MNLLGMYIETWKVRTWLIVGALVLVWSVSTGVRQARLVSRVEPAVRANQCVFAAGSFVAALASAAWIVMAVNFLASRGWQ